MKIFLAIALSVSMIFAAVPSAKADNSEEVIIGVLGGALGGLIIGSAIGRERVVVREQYIYEDIEPECYSRVFRVWDPNRDRYVKVRKVVCN